MPDDIRQYFEAEARELIDRLTTGVAALDASGSSGEDSAGIASMLRAAHTLKGAAHVVGERAMAAEAHRFEDELADFRKQPSAESAGRLLALVDSLACQLTPTLPVEDKPIGTQVDPVVERARAVISPVAPTPPMPARTVRVEVAETARLLEHVSESGVLIGSMRDCIEQLGTLVDPREMHRLERAELRGRLTDDLDRLERQMDEMHRTASQLRVASAEALLLSAGRIVRSTAAALGKRAVCVTRDAGERIEVRILDGMADAMLHLIRNAIAHGAEPPAERLAAGKPADATITIGVERQGTNLEFTCADDGCGIDVEAIRTAAVARGDLSQSTARTASREALLALLLRSGFSLSGGRPDEVSGRGVGLDAVREAAEALGGRVRIDSTPARGTTFTFTVPQTQFATTALEIVSKGRRYALPLAAVEQTFRMDAHLTYQSQGTQTLLVGRETMPLVSLYDLVPDPLAGMLRASATDTLSDEICLVLQASGRRMALTVDRVVGLSDVLVQPLPSWIELDPWLAGATLGARGIPYLVLDVVGLLAQAAQPRSPSARVPIAAPILPILVVDDSLTTRMLEQSILEAEGYQVELATSAEQGLRMARSKPYALFLVDVEMPGMNGFEFIATTRADEELHDTPAILVTSLDSAESRERGRAAGALTYIVKGEFNQPMYLDRIAKAIAGRPRPRANGEAGGAR